MSCWTRYLFLVSIIVLAATPCLGDSVSEVSHLATIIEGHLEQIKDLEFRYDVENAPKIDPSKIELKHVEFAWQRATGFEKRAKVVTSAGVPNRSLESWNGEQYRHMDNTIRTDGTDYRTAGAGSQPPDFDQFEPLLMLDLRGTDRNGTPKSLATWLLSPDVQVVGKDQVEGNPVSVDVVSINRTPSLSRSEGIVMKYWLDSSRGGIPVKTEMYVKGELRRTINKVEIKEVAQGIYLPIRYTVETYEKIGADASTDIWAKGSLLQFRIDTKSIKLNQHLGKDDFTVDFPKGTAVWNNDLRLQYFAGVGLDPPEARTDLKRLEEVTNEAINDRDRQQNSENVHQPLQSVIVPPAPMAQASSATSNKHMLWILIGVVALLCVVGAAYSRKRRFKTK